MNNYTITFGVERDRSANVIPRNQVNSAISDILKEAVTTFGGYTSTLASGGWIDPNGQLVEETSLVLTICADNEAGIRSFAQTIGEKLNQHTVIVASLLGSAEFIEI